MSKVSKCKYREGGHSRGKGTDKVSYVVCKSKDREKSNGITTCPYNGNNNSKVCDCFLSVGD